MLRYIALTACLLSVVYMAQLAGRPNVGKHPDRVPQWSPPK